MKAIQVTQPGGPEALQLVDLPIPKAEPNEGLVKVAAAGVNFVDIYQREGDSRRVIGGRRRSAQHDRRRQAQAASRAQVPITSSPASPPRSRKQKDHRQGCSSSRSNTHVGTGDLARPVEQRSTTACS